MATNRDMINANDVFTKLATNSNLKVTVSFMLLPLVDFVTSKVSEYFEVRAKIIATEISAEEKEEALNKYLDTEVVLQDLEIPIGQLKGCDLTLIDIQHIRWWLVEDSVDDYIP